MIELSSEQQQVFDKYLQGENIFITGPGGSGKSALIKQIYTHATSIGKNISVTALTGCAAILLNCKAKTIHSWAGIGLGNGLVEYIIEKIQKNYFKKKVWREANILIIDEVSMMSLKLFELLNLVGKEVRRSSRPFGGIQIIFSGDFYQLPPVSVSTFGEPPDVADGQFCFESELWSQVFKKDCQIQLIKIFRQKDTEYATILNQIREGKIKRKSYETLQKYIGRTIPEDSLIQPTKIFPVKHKVEFVNMEEMSKLAGPIYEYKIKANCDISKKGKYSADEIGIEMKYLERGLMCDPTIQLKVGSQVMCIVNMELADGNILCNGSQGIITRFTSTAAPLPYIKFNGIPHEIILNEHTWQSERYPGVGISQLPIILAWAITIHKSQGASLDLAEIDVGSDIFECGQTYVALSRVKSLEGLFLKSFDISKITINKKVQSFYSTF
jgi:ATP-dependent DNA helicase PIF1